MVRSLWTGATGMIAQQLSVDNIANNLANVNTAAGRYSRLSLGFARYLARPCTPGYGMAT
jgi:flagellar basal body rod protein FlgG